MDADLTRLAAAVRSSAVDRRAITDHARAALDVLSARDVPPGRPERLTRLWAELLVTAYAGLVLDARASGTDPDDHVSLAVARWESGPDGYAALLGLIGPAPTDRVTGGSAWTEHGPDLTPADLRTAAIRLAASDEPWWRAYGITHPIHDHPAADDQPAVSVDQCVPRPGADHTDPDGDLDVSAEEAREALPPVDRPVGMFACPHCHVGIGSTERGTWVCDEHGAVDPDVWTGSRWVPADLR